MQQAQQTDTAEPPSEASGMSSGAEAPVRKAPFRLREFSRERQRQQVPHAISHAIDVEVAPNKPRQVRFSQDPGDPDPSRLALQSGEYEQKNFHSATGASPKARHKKSRRTWAFLAAVMLLINLVAVAVIIPVIGGGSSSSSSSEETDDANPNANPNPTPPAPTTGNPPEGWRPPTIVPTLAPAIQIDQIDPTNLPTTAPLEPELYCFPSPDRLTQYTLWQDKKVQVKQEQFGRQCGPEDNRFGTSTVQVSGDELTLQFTRRTASEVRVVLPEDQVFTYGTYAFSVKSVTVSRADGTLLSNALPQELVLGLFTWDDEEAYLTYENFHHEVDIEISQWNQPNNQDAQFLVQQPGDPDAYRFWSSGQPRLFDQGGHWYNFTWNPGRIDWSTDAGVGDRVSLTTEKALREGSVDYIQCLPGNQVDVRMNLWNVLGAQVPVGLEFNDVVEVVIDNFVFEPSGLTAMEEGDYCSKNCQCATDFHCLGSRCTPLDAGPEYVPPPPSGGLPSTPYYCGCESCIQEIWDNPAPTIYQTCGERIQWLQENSISMMDACRAVAEEFPCDCGTCHADTCPSDLETTSCSAAIVGGPTWSPAPTPAPSVSPMPTTTGNLFTKDLYCFPDAANRISHTLWERATVQVKQNPPGELCGPVSNRFSDSTVSVEDDALHLRFTKGLASEVRLLLPADQLPYGYGTYSFSLQSVSVRNTDGVLLSDTLPKDLVLAMYTWQETDDESTYNNEIAIQLSRGGLDETPDLRFSTLPTGYLRSFRSYTGAGETFDQGGHWYSISWQPGLIEWGTTAGGGQSVVITTERALILQQPDHIRCPPTQNLEVRLSMWNILGSQQPADFRFDDVVEVVFDDFRFEPASVLWLEDGAACSRDCQCGGGSVCVQHVCSERSERG
jgi:hypothetical protein